MPKPPPPPPRYRRDYDDDDFEDEYYDDEERGLPKWVLPVAIAVGLFFMAILGALVSSKKGNDAPRPATTEDNTRNDDFTRDNDFAPDQITMAKYLQLKNGMTIEQVESIVGRPGEELSSNEIGGIKTIMFMWQNPGGANMNAMFQDGRMIQKSQFGLK